MKPLNETGYPFLVIARKYDVVYGDVLRYADTIEYAQTTGRFSKIEWPSIVKSLSEINAIPGMYSDVIVSLRKHGRIS